MAKKGKRREADFTRSEMTFLSDCKSEAAFKYSFESMCEYYGINKQDFKMDKDVKGGESYFPAECGELVALLVRAYKSNPAVKPETYEKMTAAGIKLYYDELLDEIDRLPKEIRDMVYSLPSHFTSNRVAIWMERLLPILSEFVIGYIDEKGEDIGALLQRMCVDIDKANYDLFWNQYYLNRIISDNEQFNEEKYGDLLEYLYGPKGTERDDIQRVLANQNLSIDNEISNLVRMLMLDASIYKERILDDNGVIDKELNREDYYSQELSKYSSEGDLRLKLETLKRYSTGAKGWKTIEEKILSEGYIPSDLHMTYEEELVARELQVEHLGKTLGKAEADLEEFRKWDDTMKRARKECAEEDLNEINKAYVDKCKKMREERKNLYLGTDRYLGQVLWEFLNKK